MRKPSGPISATRRKRTSGSNNSTFGADPATFGWLETLGPRQRPHLPLRAAPILKPPALPGDIYNHQEIPRLCRGGSSRLTFPAVCGAVGGLENTGKALRAALFAGSFAKHLNALLPAKCPSEATPVGRR